MTCTAVRHPLDLEELDRAMPTPTRFGLMADSAEELRSALHQCILRGCDHTAAMIQRELLRRMVSGEAFDTPSHIAQGARRVAAEKTRLVREVVEKRRSCVHDWQTDVPVPLVDTCAKCGEQRA